MVGTSINLVDLVGLCAASLCILFVDFNRTWHVLLMTSNLHCDVFTSSMDSHGIFK